MGWPAFPSDILDFVHRDDGFQVKEVSETMTLVWGGQLFLLSNQITWFFNHQYAWKESFDIRILVCFGLWFRTSASPKVKKSLF